jgi:hypothetical protein
MITDKDLLSLGVHKRHPNHHARPILGAVSQS